MKNGRNSEVSHNSLPLKFDSFQILRHFLTEVVLGYVFWSLMFGLPPMIWFYPLNELDFTGYEAFLAVMLIPVICVPKVFSVLQTYPAISLLRLIALGSLASFHAPSTFSRLVILSIGTPAVLVVYMTTLWSSLPFQRIITFWGSVLGLYLLLAGRIWYVSAVPTWADFKSNSIIIAVGSLATLDRILTGFDKNASYYKKKKPDATHWFCHGLGYGSFLYLIYLVLGEVSLMSRWVVTGYPNPGPQPNPWGALVFACIAWGIALSFHNHKFLKSPLWWLLGLGGVLCLYYLPTYLGFLGGLVLATFLMSIWPHFACRIIQDPPHKVMTVAMLTCMSEILFSIWTIAYNFVPGGTYTREHTDWLLYFVCAAVFLGLFIGKKENYGCELLISGHEYFKNLKAKLVLILLLSVGLSGFIYRSNYWNSDEFSSKPETKEFSSLIWTYHFGYDNNGWPSLERSAQLLNDTGADVITLLESDASKPFLGNQDLAMWLGERLRMHVDFGPSTRDHTWGTLLLSRYPIIKSQHHLLPSPHGELAPAISATVNITGQLVDFVVTHMGNDRDSLDRKLQATYLSELTRASPNPVIFMGYVTSAPYNRDYKQLTQYGRMKDIDATDNDRWCEYIMYRGLIRLGYSRISHGGLSDTELQLAKFKIPDSEDFKDNDHYIIDQKDVPLNQLFNKRFGVYKTGHHWGRDHHFHMGTPKYFLSENNGDKSKSKS